MFFLKKNLSNAKFIKKTLKLRGKKQGKILQIMKTVKNCECLIKNKCKIFKKKQVQNIIEKVDEK